MMFMQKPVRFPALRKVVEREVWLVLAILLLALALRFYDLTGESLWYDEAYSVWTSSMDILSPVVLWQWQVEFPLYYWLLHVWMRLFGTGEFSVRAFGACAGAASVLPMYYLGRELGHAYGVGRQVGAVAGLLLAVNPYHIWYSQEVRMYAWAVLTTIGSLYAFVRLVCGGRWPWWLAHVLLTGLTFHLHYYIGWIVLAQNIYYLGWSWLLSRGGSSKSGWPRLRWWLMDQVGVLLLAIPAFLVFYTKAVGLNQWGWLSQRYGSPGIAQIVDLGVVYMLGPYFPGPKAAKWTALPFVGLLLVLGFWLTLQWGRRRPGNKEQGSPHETPENVVSRVSLEIWPSYSLAMLMTVVPIAALLVLGQWSAVWVPRYLLLFLPPFLLLLALGIGAMRQSSIAAGAVLLLLALSLYASSGIYGTPQKEQWRDVAAHIERRLGAQDLIVLIDGDCHVPLGYYLGDTGRRIEVARSTNENEAELERTIAEIEGQQRGGHLWLVVSHASSENVERALDELPGLSRVETVDWVGIRLVDYVWS